MAPRSSSRHATIGFSLTEHLDELKPVQAEVASQLSEGITVRFSAEALVALRERARELGVGPSTLVRMLVLQGLTKESLDLNPSRKAS